MTIDVERDQAFLTTIRRIADEVAAPNAAAVDREARFPMETRGRPPRGAARCRPSSPPSYGGAGRCGLETIATAAFELGRRCGASAMVFAMHQIQIASIVRHVDGAPWFEAYLERVAAEQRLVASVTSEIGIGGDIGRSNRRGDPGTGRPAVVHQAGADRLVRRLRGRPASRPCAERPRPRAATRSSS